jgi:hypothetical protein
VASDASEGNVTSTRVEGSLGQPWYVVGQNSRSGGWASGPEIIYDGYRLRAFVARATFPNNTFQTLLDSSSWSDWRKLPSDGGSTRQPAAALVNDDVDVLTHWFTAPMYEQAAE